MSDNCLPIHSSNFTGEGGCCGDAKQLTLSETDLFFQLTIQGDRTPVQFVKVENTGKADVKIKKVVLTRGNIDFVLVNINNYPSVLKPGESFNIFVDFTAKVDGHMLGLLEIYTNEDRLPYVIGLSSRVRMPEGGTGGGGGDNSESIRDLYAKLLKEITDRASEDLRIAAEAAVLCTTKVAAEQMSRIAADRDEATARAKEDAALRALALNLNDIEVGIRFAADEELSRRLALVEKNQSDGTVFGVDGEARASIQNEIIIRVNADMAEAIARRTLEASLVAEITKANAKIVEESRVYADRYEALGTRTATIEVNFQSKGQVEAIADARLRTEQLARATAISAETSVRETQIATLRTTINNGLLNESIVREAAIQVERNARVTLSDATATNLSTLSAKMTGARGLTVNGTFLAGKANWTGDFAFYRNPSNVGYFAQSLEGAFRTLMQEDLIAIDTKRAYQLNAFFKVFTAAVPVNIGIQCYDANMVVLGNMYASTAAGQTMLDFQRVNHTFAGESNYPVPSYLPSNTFPAGTKFARVFGFVNAPGANGSVPGSATQFYYLYLEDITNSYAANARISLVELASTTAIGSLTNRMVTSESNYLSAKSRLDAQDGTNGYIGNELIAANARITTEENTRANAIAAEARRVDALLASYTSNGVTQAQVDATVRTESNARASAIAAEANRVNNLLANYTTSGTVDQKVSAAINEEARVRSLADQASATNLAILSASISRSGGNWLANTSFESVEGWGTNVNAPNGNPEAAFNINAAGDNYHPLGENVLSLVQNASKGGETYIEWSSRRYPISRQLTPFIQPYVFFNSHRADCDMYIVFYDDINQRNTGATPGQRQPGIGGNGKDPAGYKRLGYSWVSVPEGTTSAYMILRKYDTYPGQENSYAWFWRPYVGEAKEGQSTWNPYISGTGSAIEGSVLRQQDVLVNTQGAQARSIEEVRAIAGGASSTASIALSAAQGAQGTLGQARVRLLADAGNGRAQMDLFSDQYGISGVDIIGQTRFLGNNGGNQIIIDNNKGIDMIAPNGVHFVELGMFG